jgi:hypothetical protein
VVGGCGDERDVRPWESIYLGTRGGLAVAVCTLFARMVVRELGAGATANRDRHAKAMTGMDSHATDGLKGPTGSHAWHGLAVWRWVLSHRANFVHGSGCAAGQAHQQYDWLEVFLAGNVSETKDNSRSGAAHGGLALTYAPRPLHSKWRTLYDITLAYR